MMSRRGNRHFKKQLNNQGFSLLELLVVIAIIAVVSPGLATKLISNSASSLALG